MIYIDKYAYISALNDTNPTLKTVFGVGGLIACICSTSIVSHTIVFLTMFGVAVFKAKIPLGYYIQLMLLPFGFLVFGLIGIVVNVSMQMVSSDDCVLYWSYHQYHFFVSSQSVLLALHLLGKSLAAVTCLYFVILTVPLPEIIRFLHRLKCPSVLISLMLMMYRFIFILLEVASIKLKSQRCRGGYRSIKHFPKTFAMLWGSVFVQAVIKSDWVYKSMLVRGFDGNVRLMKKPCSLSTRNVGGLLLFFSIVIVPNFF